MVQEKWVTAHLDKVDQISVDDFHMVQVFRHYKTGELWYIPYYTRNGWYWKLYQINNEPVRFSSYPTGAFTAQLRAMNHMRRSTKK